MRVFIRSWNLLTWLFPTLVVFVTDKTFCCVIIAFFTTYKIVCKLYIIFGRHYVRYPTTAHKSQDDFAKKKLKIAWTEFSLKQPRLQLKLIKIKFRNFKNLTRIRAEESKGIINIVYLGWQSVLLYSIPRGTFVNLLRLRLTII